jgi:3-hydroxybutyryl-CoA dehydrogenase
MTIATVGLVGAGVMGRGLAETFAVHGFDVILVDITEEKLADAISHVGFSLKSAAIFKPELRSMLHEVMARIRISTDYNSLNITDIIIESTTESYSEKRDVYKKLSEICKPGCILAANTSVISIAKLAAQTADPASVLGMHFMNPVPRKSAVEVIRSEQTSNDTLAKACALLGQIGKRAIVVNDSPGFVTNRVLMLAINEAIAVLEEGISSARDVDDIFVSCLSHTMGPLATADLIGLDTIMYSLNELYNQLQDKKYIARTLLRDMVAEGRLGRKSGRGFFDYNTRSLA